MVWSFESIEMIAKFTLIWNSEKINGKLPSQMNMKSYKDSNTLAEN